MSLPKFSVENPVLVNMLMVAILVAGIYTAFSLTREMFPESRPNAVAIMTLYPGATPEEVEKGIAIRIEEEIKDIEYIDKIVTNISEGMSSVVVELTNDVADLDDKVNEFKSAVDAIPRDELPEEAEETRVSKFEPRLPVINLAIFGDASEELLKDTARRMRDDILLLPEITDVEITGIRKDELTVEVQPEKMVEYGLSLAGVTDAIRRTNLDLPGGQVKTADQNVALRTLGETDDVQTIEDTILRTVGEGKIIRVRDVGRVIDGFEDVETRGRYNGLPAVDLVVYKTGDQDAIRIAENVKAFVAGKLGAPFDETWMSRLGLERERRDIYERSLNEPYPATLNYELHGDLSRYIADRLELLQRNGAWGLSFVFLTLLLTLNWRVAFWVMMGLVLSVCGGLVLMNVFGATLNLISMFGLIVVLGLIVDDAIVVGENIYARIEKGEDPRVAAVRGTEEVTWPVVIAVATTIGAFLPLMFIEGRIGDFMGVLPIVVMSALLISLVEALMILPAHMAETVRPMRPRPENGNPPPSAGGIRGFLQTLRAYQHRIFGTQLQGQFERLVRTATHYRYVTLACAVAALLMSFGLVAGGHAEFVFIQTMDSETLVVNLEMPVGTPARKTEAKMSEIEQVIIDPADFPEVRSSYALIGTQLQMGAEGAVANNRSHVAQLIIELMPVDQRDRQSAEIITEMRKVTADRTVGVNSLTFEPMQGGPGGAAIEIEVTGTQLEPILDVVATLKSRLAEQQGVYDIDDDYERGRRELQLELLESARSLGMTTQSLATEVRGAFYGLEARTLQRNREDVDIRVRFPEQRRAHIYELESMRIASPRGTMVPLGEVARIRDDESTATIRRIDQRRAVVVSADVDTRTRTTPEKIHRLHAAADRRPGAGPSRLARAVCGEQARDVASPSVRCVAIFSWRYLLIYVMLAGLFKSYIQPLIVLAAVPFGVTGAIVGHLVMDMNMTVMSMIGLVALTGIVVNDALIMVDFIKKETRAGRPVTEAVLAAGRRRLRPILLTSLTTILGLAPLMTESSFQARFLIPMAISISFGLMFATLLTLIVVPALYLIVEDLRGFALWLRYGERYERIAKRLAAGSAKVSEGAL
jgi:HAE1 family hydrophobic/amphiphilic exporter-1